MSILKAIDSTFQISLKKIFCIFLAVTIFTGLSLNVYSNSLFGFDLFNNVEFGPGIMWGIKHCLSATLMTLSVFYLAFRITHKSDYAFYLVVSTSANILFTIVTVVIVLVHVDLSVPNSNGGYAPYFFILASRSCVAFLVSQLAYFIFRLFLQCKTYWQIRGK